MKKETEFLLKEIKHQIEDLINYQSKYFAFREYTLPKLKRILEFIDSKLNEE